MTRVGLLVVVGGSDVDADVVAGAVVVVGCRCTWYLRLPQLDPLQSHWVEAQSAFLGVRSIPSFDLPVQNVAQRTVRTLKKKNLRALHLLPVVRWIAVRPSEYTLLRVSEFAVPRNPRQSTPVGVQLASPVIFRRRLQSTTSDPSGRSQLSLMLRLSRCLQRVRP